jgi:hypothetical protein
MLIPIQENLELKTPIEQNNKLILLEQHMDNFFNSKAKKVSASVSLVWIVFWYAITMTGYNKDFQVFFIFGLMPLIIGWGIYFIWQKEFEKIKYKFSFKDFIGDQRTNNINEKNIKFKKEESGKISQIAASVLGLIIGILFYKLFGLVGIVAFASGGFLYSKLIKTESKLFSILVSILTAVFFYVVIIGIIYSIKNY